MKTRRDVATDLAAMMLAHLAGAGPASAQKAFPERPIRLVVPFTPGGTTDVFARLFANRFGDALHVPIVVDNRGGAGGLIGGAEVARGRPDGYTLIFHSPSSGITGPLIRKTPPYAPVEGFEHISILGFTPIILAVNTRLGVDSLPELVDLLRRQPGQHTYGTSGIGSGPHLTTELFRRRAGDLDIVHAPYRGASGAVLDLLAGNITFVVDTFTTLLSQQQSGQLKIIAVFGEERATVAPEVRTAREVGIDVVTRNTNYLSTSPGTPASTLELLSAGARKVMNAPDIAAELTKIAYVPVTDSTPASARAFVGSEVALWAPVIKAAGIKIE